jgi:DNA-binding transcriptional MerR regulator
VRLVIGEFSRMTHLSVKALRHYHEIGLLVPTTVDPASGYRYYDPGQVRVAEVIRRFRDLGLPLDEIKQILDAPDVPARNAVLTAHAERMTAQLAAMRSTVDAVWSLLDRPPAPIVIEQQSVSAQLALAVTDTIAAAELDNWWQAAFGELDAALSASGTDAAGVRAALYSPEFFQLEAGEVVAYVPIGREVATEGRVKVTEIPAAELAIAVHRGGFADIDLTYGALGIYVAEREIGLSGPIRERYVVSAYDSDDEASYVTEVGWPVFRTTPS